MKEPAEVLRAVERRLASGWAHDLTGTGPGPVAGASAGPRWPYEFAIGQPTGAQLAAEFTQAARLAGVWRAWAVEQQVQLRWRGRRVMGTDQELPTHLVVDDVEVAARLVGGAWPARIARGRVRAEVLAQRYPHLTTPARTLAAVDALSDSDFELLCRAADWFAVNDARGLTPRQVPIEGLHAKWLNTGLHLVRELAGVPDLGLLPRHPARIHFTYLDPVHRKAGGRTHDSATVGDRVTLAYTPSVVIISENKDTAIHFPPLPGAVSIEGDGRGGGTLAAFDWVTGAPAVFYWGDMDADGLEILDGFRAAGVPAVSILMDMPAFERWERFGTDVDERGRPLTARAPAPVAHLTDAERALYERLISADWAGVRRVEQERIPLTVARDAVLAHLAGLERR